ncbi:MAG: SpoIIE family protein phosphatase [Bdellovibrionota bacterium]
MNASLRKKLFVLLAGISFSIVAFDATLSYFSTRKFIEDSFEDSLVLSAQKSSAQVESIVRNYHLNIDETMQELIPQSLSEKNQIIKDFVAKDNNAIAYLLFKMSDEDKGVAESIALTNRVSDPRFESMPLASVRKILTKSSLNWAKHTLKEKKPFIFNIVSSGENDDVDLAVVGVNSPIKSATGSYVSIVVFWPSAIIAALGSYGNERGLLVNKEGRVLFDASNDNSLRNINISSSTLFNIAKRSKEHIGFVKNYSLRKKGDKYIGGYAMLPDLDNFTVIIQREFQFNSLLGNIVFGSFAICALFIVISYFISIYGMKNLLANLYYLQGLVRKVANGDFSNFVRLDLRDEIGVLGDSIIEMAYQVNNMMNIAIAKSKYDKELDTSEAVRRAFFPKDEITTQYFTVSGFYQSADKCGGDLWGFIPLAEGKYLVFIADAIGKGAKASLGAAMTYSALQTIVEQMIHDKDMPIDPSVVLDEMNRVFYRSNGGDISLTCFVGVLNCVSGDFIYANAGHTFPILIPRQPRDNRQQKAPKALKKVSEISPISLNSVGNPIGLQSEGSYSSKSINLRPGDKLFLYTDGLVQSESPKRKPWGTRAMMASLVKNFDKSSSVFRDKIIEAAFKHFSSSPTKDDVTVVVLEVNDSWPSIKAANNTNPLGARMTQADPEWSNYGKEAHELGAAAKQRPKSQDGVQGFDASFFSTTASAGFLSGNEGSKSNQKNINEKEDAEFKSPSKKSTIGNTLESDGLLVALDDEGPSLDLGDEVSYSTPPVSLESGNNFVNTLDIGAKPEAGFDEANMGSTNGRKLAPAGILSSSANKKDKKLVLPPVPAVEEEAELEEKKEDGDGPKNFNKTG